MGVLLVLSAVQGSAECPVATFPLATPDPLNIKGFQNKCSLDQGMSYLSLVSLEANAPLPPVSSEAASVVMVVLSMATLLISLPSVALFAPTVYTKGQ